MTSFVDRVNIHVIAGNGGHGCCSVHREKFKPLGGPDGGNGGRGGDVVLVVDPSAHTLLDFHHRRYVQADNGRPGQGDHRHGAAGENIMVKVPSGTVVYDTAGEVLADLVEMGTSYIVARGGCGGLGNAALASARRKTPGFALLGEPGERCEVALELKSLADVGLVGFPSAGKSSLVAAMSAARPKIADYPFTTLVPNLGVVTASDTTFTVADVPGLIPGAAQGRGLGLEFLRHVERCAVLVHVVDTMTWDQGRDPVSDIKALEHELAEYGRLTDRPRLIALNKVDVPDGRDLAALVAEDISEFGWPVFSISAASGEGLSALKYALAAAVQSHRQAQTVLERPRVVITPRAVDDSGFTIRQDTDHVGGFVVVGVRPLRWVRQTDFTNNEAIGYLADRLSRLGVEDALAKAGAVAGSPVTIGDVTFEWQPSIEAGGAVLLSNRGSDDRLERTDRVPATERLAAKQARRLPTDDDDIDLYSDQGWDDERS